MDQSGDRAVSVFAQRVIGLTRHAYEFASGGDNGFSQCLQRVMGIQQAHVIGGHSGGQERSAHGQTIAFFDRQIQHAFELFESADAMSGLPAPVVPVIVCGVREKAGSEQCRTLIFL